MYEITFLPDARRDLTRLDAPIRQRISKRLDWVAEHFEEISPARLKGDLSAFYKIVIGDYRALYQFDGAKRTLTIVKIQHRREVYD